MDIGNVDQNNGEQKTEQNSEHKENKNRNSHSAHLAAVLRGCNGTLMPWGRAKIAKAAEEVRAPGTHSE